MNAKGRTYGEVPEPIRKGLAEAHNPWFHDSPPDRVTVEFDAEVAHFFERKPFFPRQEIGDTLLGECIGHLPPAAPSVPNPGSSP